MTSLEQVRVAPRPDEDDFGRGDFVNQQPIRFDVTLPKTLPFTSQLMRSISRRKRSVLGKQFDCGEEIVDIFSKSSLPLEVASKSLALGDMPH